MLPDERVYRNAADRRRHHGDTVGRDLGSMNQRDSIRACSIDAHNAGLAARSAVSRKILNARIRYQGFGEPLQIGLQSGSEHVIMLMAVGNESVITRRCRHCRPVSPKYSSVRKP